MLSSKQAYIILTAVFLLILIGHYRGWLKPLEIWFNHISEPLISQSQSLSVRVGNEYQYFTNRQSFFLSYAQAVTTAEENRVDSAHLALLEQENAELKTQLNYVKQERFTSVLAQVEGSDSSGIERTITINRGSRDGLQVGEPVIVSKGVLVGKILTVDESSSQVRLISDSRSRVEAAVLNTSQTIGIVEGGFGISLRMNFVPRNETILVNQDIITSGLEGKIPRGLLIGKVVSVENEAYQGFQTITLTPGTELAKLSYVSVLIAY